MSLKIDCTLLPPLKRPIYPSFSFNHIKVPPCPKNGVQGKSEPLRAISAPIHTPTFQNINGKPVGKAVNDFEEFDVELEEMPTSLLKKPEEMHEELQEAKKIKSRKKAT